MALILWILIDTTPTVPNYVAYSLWSNSNLINFDQVYRKIYYLLQNQINIIRIIMRYTFTFYIFSIVVKFYKAWVWLKDYTQNILAQRKYLHACMQLLNWLILVCRETTCDYTQKGVLIFYWLVREKLLIISCVCVCNICMHA
jgi:hypothetical protein